MTDKRNTFGAFVIHIDIGLSINNQRSYGTYPAKTEQRRMIESMEERMHLGRSVLVVPPCVFLMLVLRWLCALRAAGSTAIRYRIDRLCVVRN